VPARLTVLHVVDIPPDLFETPGSALAAYRASCIEKASAQTKDAIRMLVSPSTLTADMVTSGRSYREVMRVAVEHADLIVMGIRGRGALDLLFFGSTTNPRGDLPGGDIERHLSTASRLNERQCEIFPAATRHRLCDQGHSDRGSPAVAVIPSTGRADDSQSERRSRSAH
jgi:hypothetical protein